ncbi:MAG: Gfo/Idh/MocA family protein [Candidatus Cyclobacteriaceae bacterium M3_2C_046]
MMIKTGIIGAGMIARFHAKAVSELEEAQLVGICDNGSGKAQNLATEFNCKAFNNYADLLNQDLDLALITSPSGLHMEPAVLAAEKGIHVLCEKPLEINLDRVDQMIKAHQQAGTYLGGIFNYRYNEGVWVIKEAVDEGRLGKLTYAAIHVPWWRNQEYYKDSWHGTLDLDGGGALMNQSIHMVDLLQYLVGPVDSLMAYKATLGHEIEAEDIATAILKLKNGALGYVFGTTASFPGQFRRIELTGTEGTIVMVENSITVWQFKQKRADDEEILQKFGMIEGGGGVADPAAMTHHNHLRNIAAFISAINQQKPFEIDGKEARKAVEIVRAIYHAADSGKEVNF